MADASRPAVGSNRTVGSGGELMVASSHVTRSTSRLYLKRAQRDALYFQGSIGALTGSLPMLPPTQPLSTAEKSPASPPA